MINLLTIPRRILAYLRAVFDRSRLEREMQNEMAEHLSRATDRLMERGLSVAQARTEARREFGNVASLQEEARDARGASWLDSLRRDLRFALRQIVRRPLSSATIVCVLAIGIGVHAGLFAFLQAITLRPAPGVRADEHLVQLRGKEQRVERGPWYPRAFSYPEYVDLAARRDLFTATTAWVTDPVTIDFGDPQSATTAQMHFVTGEYFAVAGVHVALGTTLPLAPRADVSTGELAAIVSDAMWRDLFGEASDAVGRTIRVNETLVRVVGVAPPRFAGLTPSSSRRTLWMPLESRTTVMRGTRRALLDRDSALVSAAALLAANTSIERATTAVQLVSERAVARMTPATDGRARTADVVPLRPSYELPETNDILFASAIFGTLGMLVLMVVCTNVSALVLGAGVVRSQEIAIRLSLGASRRRIVRQLLTESCVLALAGGAAGLALFAVIVRLLVRAMPDLDVSPDLRTAGFTVIVALAAGIMCGLSPALHATKRDVADVLKGGSASSGAARRRLQASFVGAQIAMTQPLLLGIAVLLALVLRQNERPITDDVSTHIVRLRFDLRRAAPSDRARLQSALEELEGSNGVVQVVPEASGLDHLAFAYVDAQAADSSKIVPIRVNIEQTDPGYFSILNVPIVRGRDVLPSDTTLRDLAVVISSDVAHELWGNADPLGRRFRQIQHDTSLAREAVVVGVYDGTKGTTRGAGRRVFTIGSGDWRGYSYLVRTSGPAGAAVPSIRERIRATLPQIPPARMETLKDVITGERREVLGVGAAAAAGGALVLLLASIGLYGVIGLAVAQRRREIGIRIALGARASGVVGLLFRQGLRLAGIGTLVGLPLSIGVLEILARITTGDGGAASGIRPTIIGLAIAFAVLVVASVATWLPARRAATVDPMIALRAE